MTNSLITEPFILIYLSWFMRSRKKNYTPSPNFVPGAMVFIKRRAIIFKQFFSSRLLITEHTTRTMFKAQQHFQHSWRSNKIQFYSDLKKTSDNRFATIGVKVLTRPLKLRASNLRAIKSPSVKCYGY